MMTDTLRIAGFTCSEGACEIASGGTCLDGFPSAAACPHAAANDWSGDAPDREVENDVADEKRAHAMPTVSAPVVVPGDEALTLSEAGDLMARHRVTMVLVAGEAAVGKTTLVTELFARFLSGPFNGWTFGGSETLRAFHIRLHPSLAESGAGTPRTERTADEDMRYLHLCLSRHGVRRQILASDGKGEYFENLIERGGVATEIPIASRADRCVLAVDGARLDNPRLRDSTISRARLLLRALTGPNGLSPVCPIAILCTKWDEVKVDHRETVLERLDQLASLQYREVSVLTATVRPGPPKVEVGGLEQLLDFIAPLSLPAPHGAARSLDPDDGTECGRHFWRVSRVAKDFDE